MFNSPSAVAVALGFTDSLRLAYRLLYNRKWEEEPQQYSIELILAVKNQFPDEWEKDWRNEGFLGSAYNVVLGDDNNFDERYYAYMRAYKKANPAPPELLIELAGCWDAPGKPLISSEMAIDLLNKSFEIEPYADAAGLLSHIYCTTKKRKNSRNIGKERSKELQAQGKSSRFY